MEQAWRRFRHTPEAGIIFIRLAVRFVTMEQRNQPIREPRSIV